MKYIITALGVLLASNAMATNVDKSTFAPTDLFEHDTPFSATVENPVKVMTEYRYSYSESDYNSRGNKPYYQRNVTDAYDYMVYDNKNIVKKLGSESIISDLTTFGSLEVDPNPYNGYEMWSFIDHNSNLDTSTQVVNSPWFISKGKDYNSSGYTINLNVKEQGDYRVRLFQEKWKIGLGLQACINDVCDGMIIDHTTKQITASKLMVHLKDVSPTDKVTIKVMKAPYVYDVSTHHIFQGLIVFKEGSN